jgi:hypothetical protein
MLVTGTLTGLLSEVLMGRARGMFFAGRHPWVAVVVLAILVLLVLYVQRNRR